MDSHKLKLENRCSKVIVKRLFCATLPSKVLSAIDIPNSKGSACSRIFV